MGAYEVTSKGGKTVVKKNHPILNAWLILFAVVLALGSFVANPAAGMVAVGFIALVIWAGGRTKRSRPSA